MLKFHNMCLLCCVKLSCLHELSQTLITNFEHVCAQAMLEAEKGGRGWKQLGLLPAPHFHDKDGSVKVPPK